MSAERYCGQCGNLIAPGERYCGKCGAPVSKQKKGRRKATLLLGLVCIVLLISAVLAVRSFTGYRGAVRKTMNAFQSYDVDTLVNMSSRVFDFYDVYGMDHYVNTYFTNIIADVLDHFESEVGHDYKFSYQIKDAYTASERKYDTVLTQFVSGVATAEDAEEFIRKVQIVDLELTASKGDKKLNISKTLYLTKEDGTWRILAIE